MTAPMELLLLVPAAYLLGSIPFGLIVGLSRGVDPRKAGSGNIGATNVGRLLGGRYFAIVFLLDMLKGALPMLAAGQAIRGTTPDATLDLLWLLVGLAAIVGHMFPIYLKFKGGKGVATSCGVAMGVFPYYTIPALLSAALFLIIFKIWRYVSLASICAAIAFPIFYLALELIVRRPGFRDRWPLLLFSLFVAAMITFRHRTNIARLRAGNENRIEPKSP
ncbi:MAG TPA: glycerol-3-phosphate 1-O-acyltransferase PlsY [Tepidisphaeraceae bacterium]|jgi:glycerol-3-phosphate acyltransferase PlsY